MKITFRTPNDGKAHTYCPSCLRDGVIQSQRVKGNLFYRCTVCAYIGPRALIVDPEVSWWVDGAKEYWHQTGGIFLYNAKREFLFFERTTFPFGLAVPAGHVDRDEKPLRTSQRELHEETNVKLSERAFQRIATDDIRGDRCRRGADVHRWHSFACAMPASATIKVDPKESSRPVWLTLEQAMRRDLTFATRYVIQRHGRKLNQVARG